MKYPWAVPGQKVECIKVGEWSYGSDCGPAFGDVLEVVEAYVAERLLFLQFKETDPISGYWADQFRPVYPQKRASDIAQFERHLNSKTVSKPSQVDA